MARIRHPGVVAVHDFHRDSALAFLVMEYVAGESLSRRLHRSGRLPPGFVMALVAQAADALQAAHETGVVHRDVKPGNLLVTAEDTVVLTDFGIARSMASAPMTATGVLIGTVAYLAPEQVLGKPATPRSDVYALGVVAYECLAGRRPFDGGNPFELAMRRVQEAPPALPADVPPAVVAVVERALAADPERRWPSAAELAGAARRAAPAGPVAPAGPGVPPASAYQIPPPHPPGYQAPPSQPGYQPPAYPVTGYQAPAQPRPLAGLPGQPQNTLGMLALIFGILSLPLAFCCSFLGVPLGVAAVVLGVLGIRKAAAGLATNRGMALAGLIWGGIGVFGSIGLGVLNLVAGNAFG
jgi:serine/threonine-protein kinase